MDAPRSVRMASRQPLGFAGFAGIIVWGALGVILSTLIGGCIAIGVLSSRVTSTHSFQDEWSQSGVATGALYSAIVLVIMVVIGVFVGTGWTKVAVLNSLPDGNDERYNDINPPKPLRYGKR